MINFALIVQEELKSNKYLVPKLFIQVLFLVRENHTRILWTAPLRIVTHTHTHIYVCVYMYVYIYIYIYMCVCVCV